MFLKLALALWWSKRNAYFRNAPLRGYPMSNFMMLVEKRKKEVNYYKPILLILSPRPSHVYMVCKRKSFTLTMRECVKPYSQY